jgi:DNA-3-methyladenine glycosylase I
MPDGPPARIIPKSLNDYLEVMSKSIFQTGLSWKLVEYKWPGIKKAFHNFDVRTIVNFKEKDIESLTTDTRVIRNYRKILAIIANAQKMLELEQTYGSFQKYLRAHGSFDATLKALRKEFKFMGPTGIYVFLYVVGEPVIPHEEFERQYKQKSRR